MTITAEILKEALENAKYKIDNKLPMSRHEKDILQKYDTEILIWYKAYDELFFKYRKIPNIDIECEIRSILLFLSYPHGLEVLTVVAREHHALEKILTLLYGSIDEYEKEIKREE